VTDDAQHRGRARRVRQKLADEPSVSATAGSDDQSLFQETASHRADAGFAWGLLIHGLLEHAMRHEGTRRADLERLALWLTVEFPDLRPYISGAVDVVQGVANAPFWREAQPAADCHGEVPYGVRQTDSAGLPTAVRGVIDLVYRPGDAWRILGYKTDQDVDPAILKDRYGSQLEQYANAWSRITSGSRSGGALYLMRSGNVLQLIEKVE
jgi:ATP-dependent exoDNAse (exonuclease V) beta subunit